MNKATIQEALPELGQAFGETLLMVSVSFVLTVLLGGAVGVLLLLTAADGLQPNRPVSVVLGAIVNLGRSLPFLILMIALIPLTRLIAGTAYGSGAAIVPLTIGCIPFFARVVEAALREVSPGKIEAAQAMGATKPQIVSKVLLPEAQATLIAGATLTLVMLIGFSTMAGVIGGGGVGDFAIRYGYQRFNTPVLLTAVAILIVLVQLIQSTGDLAVRRLAHLR